jgi:hypothetical protein
MRALEREENNVLAENAMRYQLEALFIANGQRANPSSEHQYPELRQLFAAIAKRLDAGASQRMQDRLTAIAGTYYSQAGGDGGPGQMGYITPGASDMMGKAVLASWKRAEDSRNPLALRLAVESGANIVYDPLQKKAARLRVVRSRRSPHHRLHFNLRSAPRLPSTPRRNSSSRSCSSSIAGRRSPSGEPNWRSRWSAL